MFNYLCWRRFQHQDNNSEMVLRHPPNLRVAHQTLTEANCSITRQECGGSMFVGDFIHVRGVSCLDSVAFGALLSRDTPTIMDAAKKHTVSESAGNS